MSNHKLTPEDVHHIWQLTTDFSDRELADKFEVSISSIAYIFTGRTHSRVSATVHSSTRHRAMVARRRRLMGDNPAARLQKAFDADGIRRIWEKGRTMSDRKISEQEGVVPDTIKKVFRGVTYVKESALIPETERAEILTIRASRKR